jgi:polyferredoxin
MRRFAWIPWRWWRRAVQLALLVLFLWLFRRTEYGGTNELAGGENLFFRLDPLAGAAAMIAARQFLAMFWPAVIVVLLTLVFGRFFCGWVCPLGTLLDYFHRLLRPIARRTNRLLASNGMSAARYVILLAVLLAAVFAYPLIGLVDPFSLLVRAMALWGDPVLYQGTDTGLGLIGGRWGMQAVDPFVRKHLLAFGPATFRCAGLSAAILATIFALEFVARRFWCRYLCPLGGMLGLVGRRPLLRRVPAKACKSCGNCTTMCRMDAVDSAGFAVEKCNLCMDCVDFCPQGIVKFGWRRPKGRPRPVDLSRRSALVGVVAGAGIPGVAAAVRMVRPASTDPYLLRPPGAEDEKTFLSLCIRCGECMKVCPTRALQPTVLEAGLEGLFSPRLLPRFVEKDPGEFQNCCEYTCTLCGQVCPTGAIPRLTEYAKHSHPTGKAYFDHSLCLPWAKQTPCIRCEEMCPTPEKAIKILKTFTVKGEDGEQVEIQQPYVDRTLCVGCGNCESKCTLDGPPGIRVQRVEATDPGTESQLKPKPK